ncbi:MAG: MCE family protein [Rhodoferax sp.]|mgnify:FL=1|nr:MCE family protein [Rhodoferax sp.]MBP7573996.1 MCE family protein [Rhodoferax sp.]
MDSSNQSPPPVANLELKARLLILLLVLLLLGSVVYVLVARGAFERTQQLVLVADDSEGIVVGMDLTFSGFPIGRVGRIELSADGNARILVDVPRKDAHWLRTSSVFTMESGLVGGTRIRAFSGMLTDPPLPDGAIRRVLRGDAKAEIPLMVASVRELVSNLSALTGPEAPLNGSLRNVQTATEKLNGPSGGLGLLFGNEADARKIITTLDRTNALLARLDALALKADGVASRTDALIANADKQVFGPTGVLGDAQATVIQLNGLLADARNSLRKVDAVLQEAQAIGANTREATNDLGALRAEVEGSLRKVEHLVNEINRKWPFARDAELKLP